MIKIHLIASLLLIILQLSHLSYAFHIEPVKLELLDDTFRVSIPNDPNIRWVAYNVNINKEFRAFEAGQLSALANIPEEGLWSFEFQRVLKDDDLIYIWLAIQYNNVVFRDKQGPISVAAVRRGDQNVIVSPPKTQTAPLGSTMTSSSTTTTTTTMKPTIMTRGPAPEPDKLCFPTVTEVSIAGKYCKGDILFDENFDRLLPNRWANEVRIPLDTSDSEFVVYNGTARVEDGILKIPAALYLTNVVRGTLDLENRCTSFNYQECRLDAQGSFYLPPVESGRINTRQSFSFKYGRIEVRAKLPKGDWLVPLISLEPTMPKYGPAHYTNGEMRIAFARGNHQLNSDNTNIDGQRLFGGVIFNKRADFRHQFMANVTLDQVTGNDEHFGNQYHLYSMIWKPQEILLSVDGYQYGKIKTNFKESMNENAWRLGPENAPLDQMYYLTLGLSAGGHGDFPNHSENKPWKNGSPRAILEFYNKRGDWRPSWEQPELDVDFVRVYAI